MANTPRAQHSKAPMTDDKRLDDLPDLPELAELKDLSELPELEDIPELPDEAALAAEAPAKAAPKPAPPDLAARRAPVLPPLEREADELDRKVDEMGELPEEEPEELEPLEEEPVVPAARRKTAPTPVPKKPMVQKPVAPAPRPVAPAPAAAKPAPAPAPAPEPVEERAAPAEAPVAAAAVVSAPGASASPATPGGEKPPLRELDRALVHLRLAAKIVVLGALLPFMLPKNEATLTDGIAFSFGSKLVVLAAAWVWMQQVLNNWEPRSGGLLAKLASLHLKPKALDKKQEKKTSRLKPQPTTLEHPFPTGLHLLSVLLMVAAIAIAVQDPRSGIAGPLAVAEMGMVGWAAFTVVHIASYERWGHFNPLFPLMFLGMLFAGLASVLGGIGAGGAQMAASILGGAAVGAGGGFAAYTIVESMMHAKKVGDQKKREALEARKAARKAAREERSSG